MRGRYFIYRSNSSDYSQVIQTTCGSLQSKICRGKGFFPFSDFFKAGFPVPLGSEQTAEWVSEQPQGCAGAGVAPRGAPEQLQPRAHAESSYAQTAQLLSSLGLGNPQPGKAVNCEFCELLEQHMGARSALGMVPQNFQHLHKICYRVQITSQTVYRLYKSDLR